MDRGGLKGGGVHADLRSTSLQGILAWIGVVAYMNVRERIARAEKAPRKEVLTDVFSRSERPFGAIGPSGQVEFVANDFRIWKKCKSFLPLHI